MRHHLLLVVLLLSSAAQYLYADEPTRRAQEELRKRNLYFSDINGQTNQEFAEALKRYQTRKGFNPTGELDGETASSLKIEIAAAKKSAEQSWPEVPVLKSDAARDLAQPDEANLQPDAEQEAASSATPAPPAEPPTKAEELQAERITKFVRDYLHDAESDDVDLQVRYYAFPVGYFDHGRAGRGFVARDTRNYVKRWPQRKYTLIGPVKFFLSDKGGEVQVEFTIEFRVRNEKHAVIGKTRNFWTVRPKARNFKIITINEQRLYD